MKFDYTVLPAVVEEGEAFEGDGEIAKFGVWVLGGGKELIIV